MANVVISGRGSAAQARGRLSLGLTLDPWVPPFTPGNAVFRF